MEIKNILIYLFGILLVIGIVIAVEEKYDDSNYMGYSIYNVTNTTSIWFNGNFNWTVTDDWNTFDGSVLNFNESKLSSVYFNVTQSEIITFG